MREVHRSVACCLNGVPRGGWVRLTSYGKDTFVRFKLEEGDLKYLDDARELIRPEKNTLTVSFLDIEEHSTKLATLVQEHYYQ